jgi:multicomponent Na+:H+ antiporter subunit E
MPDKTQPRTHRLRDFTYLLLFLFIIWLALTSSFHWQELITGFVISLVLSLILHKNYLTLGLPPFSIKRLVYAVVYIVVLLVEIIKANLDVAYRVIHPKLPIRPGIVVIETTLKQDIAKLILANSITLTPGTFTLDILEDRLLIHWINVQSVETTEATKIIGERFEKYLSVIFS